MLATLRNRPLVRTLAVTYLLDSAADDRPCELSDLRKKLRISDQLITLQMPEILKLLYCISAMFFFRIAPFIATKVLLKSRPSE